MQANKLILSTTRISYLAHKTHKVELANKLQTFQRDSFTCIYCGFSILDAIKAKAIGSDQVERFLDVHHRDDNHSHSVLENLETVCHFCHGVFHAGCLDEDSNRKFKVILYPWLSQAELNCFMNLVFSAKQSGNDSVEHLSEQIIDQIDACSLFADTAICNGISNVKNLANSLLSLSYQQPEVYAHRAELLAGIRLFPSLDAFENDAQLWGRSWLPTQSWATQGEQWLNP